ncbi:MAG: hypothetical protein ACMG6S_07275 [Byssovorax sp.]
MPFEPDIIVTKRDAHDLALVVEVKPQLGDVGAAEGQLRRYMFGMGCPVGMLVTPQTLRLYQDRYKEYGEGSVEFVGEFPTDSLFAADSAVPKTSGAASYGFDLENAVQSWLERLADGAKLSALPEPLRRALEEHVIPALAHGEVRAARPRWRPTGT